MTAADESAITRYLAAMSKLFGYVLAKGRFPPTKKRTATMSDALRTAIEAAEKAGHTDATITAGDLAAACETMTDDPHAAGLLRVAQESVNAGRPGTPIGLPVGHLRRLVGGKASDGPTDDPAK